MRFRVGPSDVLRRPALAAIAAVLAGLLAANVAAAATVTQPRFGAVELVSPGNKDRATERRAFATKCAGYLYSGIGLIVVDVVTERTANLHNEIVRVMDGDPGLLMPEPGGLYAVAYRPVVRDWAAAIDQWVRPLAVGGPLPELPLRLVGDFFVSVDFEAAYQEACRRRRIA